MEGIVSHDDDMFKITAKNYSYCKLMMEDRLYWRYLHEPIIKYPKGKNDKERELLDSKAVAMMWKYIDQSLFEHESTKTSAYELWTKLESMILVYTRMNYYSFIIYSEEFWTRSIMVFPNLGFPHKN